ncbi:MAG: ABC transporter permease [Eubacteriales bacterium]
MKVLKKIFSNKGVLTLISSLLCILLGLFVGYIVLLCINPEGAWKAIVVLVKNCFYYTKKEKVLSYLGSTLVKTAPLLLCSLSVLFAYKAGLFNIGASGQYAVGAGVCLWLALGPHLPWYVCVLAAMAAGALWGTLSGLLKAFCNVNEVISCIMLNWISLYLVNELLKTVKEGASPNTLQLAKNGAQALLPSLGLGKLFAGNKFVTIAIPISVIVAVVVWVVLEKTKFGYELKATGFNRNAARYCGMKEKRNIVLTMAIAGMISGLAAAMLYLTGIEQWHTSASSVPSMGFDGIAAAFLGGLHPIGTIFSSYFIKHISLGGAYIDKSLYSAQVSDLIAAIIIYLCAFVLFFKQFMMSRLTRSRAAAKPPVPESEKTESLASAEDKPEETGKEDN